MSIFYLSFFVISNHRVQERAKYFRFYRLLQAFTLIHMYLALFSFAYPPCVPCILNQKGGYSLWKSRPKLNPTESAALQRLEHDLITDSGTVPATKGRHAIHCLTVIGTIEGHTLAPDAQKTTKYEHVIPQLVDIEEDPEIEGLLVILNTVGGDVEAGLALAELIAGVNKPSATLVLGGGHSIGIPLAVSARRSFIVPTATMTVHPVRHSGMVLGVPQTLRYFEQMQERIVGFVASHSKITARRFTALMHNTGELVMDMGTVLDGRQAVEEGLIDELGGLGDALRYLYKEIESGR